MTSTTALTVDHALISLKGELDDDHKGRERKTAPGSVGFILSVENFSGEINYSVGFRHNGASIFVTDEEARNPELYTILTPEQVRQIVMGAAGPYDLGDDDDEDGEGVEVPDDFPVRPLQAGDKAADLATCGHCGRSWDDAVVTSYTPAPGARCPFEAFH